MGRLIPLGDLWDVLVDGTGAAFTDRLKRESEAAVKFYAKARTHLLGKYGSDTHTDFLADHRSSGRCCWARSLPTCPRCAG
ncbi:hypothetical protein [Streptomyces pactum]|uniref:Uncharacterized protein n=1 Tax=Streptomyces pactum TaxID=68249 RepID=A0A1S6J8H5_9ACTN|nr:hypothetical protein [Streptomyces pactum]AQS68011.1 hypothetical protein B1H29_14690 [Streptomyces pactum]